MGEIKHTPGPLTVVASDDWPFDHIIVDKDGSEVFREPMTWVSSVSCSFDEAMAGVGFESGLVPVIVADNARALADARLRAAAPEMKEAIEALLSASDPMDEAAMPEEYAALRAALAKTNGEAPQ